MDKSCQSETVRGTRKAVQNHFKSDNGRTYPMDESGVMSQQTGHRGAVPRGRGQRAEGLKRLSTGESIFSEFSL